MAFRLLADLVLIAHLLFIVFVVAGAALVARWNGLMPVHLLAVAWGAAIEFAGWVCPLTPLEKWARNMAGEAGYDSGFIEHYLAAIIYPGGLTRGMQLVLGVFVLLINLFAYLMIFKRRRKKV